MLIATLFVYINVNRSHRHCHCRCPWNSLNLSNLALRRYAILRINANLPIPRFSPREMEEVSRSSVYPVQQRPDLRCWPRSWRHLASISYVTHSHLGDFRAPANEKVARPRSTVNRLLSIDVWRVADFNSFAIGDYVSNLSNAIVRCDERAPCAPPTFFSLVHVLRIVLLLENLESVFRDLHKHVCVEFIVTQLWLSPVARDLNNSSFFYPLDEPLSLRRRIRNRGDFFREISVLN